MALDTQLFSHSIKETCLAFTPSEKQRVNLSAYCCTHKCISQTRPLSLIHIIIPPWAHEPLKTQIVFLNKFALYKDITKSAIKVRKQTLKQHTAGVIADEQQALENSFRKPSEKAQFWLNQQGITQRLQYHCREITGLYILGDTTYLSAIFKRVRVFYVLSMLKKKLYRKSIIMKDCT